nr:N-acetylglucosamine-6-phosphate deacetylase [Streptococcus mitis]
MTIFIFADKFFLEEMVIGPGFLEVKDGKFGVFLEDRPKETAKIIEYRGHWIAPGLVDTHIHGFRNHDIMDNSFEGL